MVGIGGIGPALTGEGTVVGMATLAGDGGEFLRTKGNISRGNGSSHPERLGEGFTEVAMR